MTLFECASKFTVCMECDELATSCITVILWKRAFQNELLIMNWQEGRILKLRYKKIDKILKKDFIYSGLNNQEYFL